MKKKTKNTKARIGVLGGAFNPVHAGHLNAALGVKEALELDKVLLVPSNKAPLRDIIGPEASERMKMVEIAAAPYAPELEVSDLEIERGGVSYTYETLKELGKQFNKKNIYFILGADNLAELPQWKNFEDLLSLSNFVVTTRPGSSISFEEDLPKEFAPFVKKADSHLVKLKSGMTIQFVELDDIKASSTEIRKRLRVGHEVKSFLPPKVLEYIESKKFYRRTLPLVKDYREFSVYCRAKALDKKALGVKLYDMSRNNGYADYSIICSGTSTKHASSIADGILRSVREDFGLSPISLEGQREGQWVLIDFGAVVVHVFEDVVRGTYNIEGLWKNCPQFS